MCIYVYIFIFECLHISLLLLNGRPEIEFIVVAVADVYRLHHAETHCNTLQHFTKQNNAPQRTATHGNTLGTQLANSRSKKYVFVYSSAHTYIHLLFPCSSPGAGGQSQ